ncbi:zinc finger, CCHC-type containing protein [Tanacetum coccineum]
MVEHNNSYRYNDKKGKRKHHDNTKDDPNKKSKVTCWKCRKPGHLKKDCKGGKVGNKANGSGTNGLVDGSTNSLKGQNMFNNLSDYESLNDGSILHMGNESTSLVCGRGCVDLKFSSGRIVSLLGHVHFKRMQDMSKDGLIPAFDMDTENDLCDLHATPSLGNKKYFVTFIDDASRFYVIESNDLVLINSIIESRDAIFDENRFSSVPRPSLRIPNRTEDIGGSVVPEKVTEEVVQQPEPELRKSKRNRTPKDFGPKFQLYLIKGTRDEVFDQHSYCFNVEDDPKTFYETMKSQDVAF